MRLASDRVAEGMTRYWMCLDRRCTGIVHAETTAAPRRLRDDLGGEDLARASDAYLGDSIGNLMRAAATPQGSGGSGSRAPRRPKAGEVQANRERLRERRGATQEALIGARDKTVKVEKVKKVLGGRLPDDLAEFARTVRERGRTDSELLRDSVTAYRDRLAKGEPCASCEFPIYRGEPQCPRCGTSRNREGDGNGEHHLGRSDCNVSE